MIWTWVLTGFMLLSFAYANPYSTNLYSFTDAVNGNTTTFLELIDTPNNYTGSAGSCVKVNVGESALEFGTCGNTTTSGGNPFDQSLNTTDDVVFKSVNSSDWSNVSITESQISDLTHTSLTNVAFKNESNTFTQEQVIQLGGLGSNLRINYLGIGDLFKFDTSLGYIVLQSMNNLQFFLSNDDYTATIALQDNGDIDLTPSTRARVYGNLTANEVELSDGSRSLRDTNNLVGGGGASYYLYNIGSDLTPQYGLLPLMPSVERWYYLRDEHGSQISPSTTLDTFTFETGEGLNTTILGSGGVNITLTKSVCGIDGATIEQEDGSPTPGQQWSFGNGAGTTGGGVPIACNGTITSASVVCSGTPTSHTAGIRVGNDGSATMTNQHSIVVPITAWTSNYSTGLNIPVLQGQRVAMFTESSVGTEGTCWSTINIAYE